MSSVPLIPEASSIIVSSGNIIDWKCLKSGKIVQSTTEELKDALSTVFDSCLPSVNWEEEGLKTSLQFVRPKCKPNLSNDREELKVTVKVMACNTDPDILADAIKRVMEELETTKLDVVLLAVSEKPNALETFDMDHFKTLWTVLENFIRAGQIDSLGVCDLQKPQLEELFHWAQVKPTIDQVNEVSCCIIPPDLNAFAKENRIQLLTHSDFPDILPTEDLQSIIKESFSESDAAGWHAAWVLRYTSLIRCRGVITTKGYIMRAMRNLDHL